jgi:arylsulfatase
MKPLISIVTILLLSHSVAAREKPNIVYILVDNWGWGDIGVQGSTVPSPRIDAFASESTRFTNFNVQNQCTPTRSAIMTGRLPIRTGNQRVPAPGEPTAAYGKWHIGDKDGRLPNDQGFDEWYGIKESAMLASFTSTPQFDPKIIPIPHIWQGKKGRKTEKVKEFDLEARAILDSEVFTKTGAFMRVQADAGKPFFVYVALTQIHPPFLPQPGFVGKSKAGPYADIQMQVDFNVVRSWTPLPRKGWRIIPW